MLRKTRFLALIIAFCLTFASVMPIQAAEKSDETSLDSVMGALTVAGIATKQIYAQEELLLPVTRAEFIGYASKAINVSGEASDKEFFVDIADSKQKNVINKFAEYGYISVEDDRLFEPDRNITQNEAVKIVVEMMGYGKLAQAMGGFPSGYINVANRIDLIEFDSSSELNLYEMFCLLGNALEIELNEPTSYSIDGTISFGAASGKTLLSIYHDTYILDGFVSAVGDLTITGKEAGMNMALIGGENFKVDEEMLYTAQNFVGQWVRAFYEEKTKGVRNLIYICDDGTRYTEIELKDIIEFDSDYTLTCYENGKDKDYKIDRSVTVIYNGEAENENHIQLLNSFDANSNGTIKLIDSDNNRKYDYCIIKHYVDVYVDEADEVRGIVFNVKNDLKIAFDDYDNVKIFNSEGEKMEPTELRGGMILSYAESKNKKFIEGYAASELFTDEIESVSVRDGVKTFTIEGVPYVVLDHAVEDLNIGVGDLASFRTNKFGQISHIVPGDVNAYKYALLLESEIESGFNKTLWLKYFSQDGKMMASEVSEKVTVDGKVYKDAEKALIAIPNSTTSRVYPQIVRISMDANSKINNIDTAYCSYENENSETSLIETPAKSDEENSFVKYIDGNYQRVAPNLVVDKKTPIFCTPSREDILNMNYEDDDFWLAPQVERDATAVIYGATMVIADTVGYRVGYDTFAEGALICYNRPRETLWYQGNYLMAVSKVGSRINAEGEDETYISGYVYAKARDLIVADEYVSTLKEMDLEEGDVIIWGFDKNEEITEVRMIYDASQGGEPYDQEGSGWATPHKYDDTDAINFECHVYYVANQDGRVVKLWQNTNEYTEGICDLIMHKYNVTIVDLGEEVGNRVRVRPMEDVDTAIEVGASNASLALVRSSWDTEQEIIVINY